MSSFFDIINVPIGYLMRWCYALVSNYGVAIILVCVITKLLMIPLAVKQQKGSLSQMKFAPRVREIQEKYANDRDRQQREMQKLQSEGYSPTAGCGPVLIQFPILIGIYNVIRNPLKYLIGLSDEVLTAIAERMTSLPGFETITVKTNGFAITALDTIKGNYSYFADILDGTKFFDIDMNLFGLNLAEIPPTAVNILKILPIPSFASWLVIIPVISALTAAASTILAQKMGPAALQQQSAGTPGNKGTMMFMNVLGPYMSYAIAFVVPAGLGLYWIVSNIWSAVQTVIINKIYSPAKYKQQIEQEEAERKARIKKRQEQERLARQAEAEAAKKPKGKKGSGGAAALPAVVDSDQTPVELDSKSVDKADIYDDIAAGGITGDEIQDSLPDGEGSDKEDTL